MTPSEPVRYHPQPLGELRPLQRRETIRQALEQQDWRVAAAHLHQAHTAKEWLSCGHRSHSAYIESLGISRMYDWQLRFVHQAGCTQASYSFRHALRQARSTTP